MYLVLLSYSNKPPTLPSSIRVSVEVTNVYCRKYHEIERRKFSYYFLFL